MFSVTHTSRMYHQILEKILEKLRPGAVILLYGDMGAGKTYLVQQICKLLHVTDHVSSPTYSITHHYRSDAFNILHSDLYRVTTLDALLLDQIYQPDCISFIEWPQLIEDSKIFHDIVKIVVKRDCVVIIE